MPGSFDVTGKPFNVGDIVNVPCSVTAVTATLQNGIPRVTLTPIYRTPDDSAPSTITSVYATQTVINR